MFQQVTFNPQWFSDCMIVSASLLYIFKQISTESYDCIKKF